MSYSIDQLKADKTTLWEGVRNYQARNFMMKEMQPGDGVLFYHSNAKALWGWRVWPKFPREPSLDPSQFQKKGEYFDPKATPGESSLALCGSGLWGEVSPTLSPLGGFKIHKGLGRNGGDSKRATLIHTGL